MVEVKLGFIEGFFLVFLTSWDQCKEHNTDVISH